jgi:diguanylate cyclase (GGDEF)-like protein
MLLIRSNPAALLFVAMLAAWVADAHAAEPAGLAVSILPRDVPAEATRDVIAGGLDASFEAVAADRIKRRPGASSLWIRVKFERAPEGVQTPVLVVRQTRAARVTLFSPSGKPAAQSLYSDDPSPRFARNAVYFPLEGRIKAGDTYYLQVDQLRSGSLALDLQDIAAVNANNLTHARIVAFAVGALLALGITALLIWTWLPERGFLYLGMSILFGALYDALLLGDGYAWLPFAADNLVAFNMVQVAGAMGMAFDILFFRELLDFGRYARRLSAMMKGLAIYFFTISALLFAAGGELMRFITMLGNLGALAVWALIVPSMVAASIRGSSVGRLLFLGWAPTTLFTIPHAMTYLRGEPEQPWIVYGFAISLVVGFVFKSLALAARLRLQRSGRSFVASEAPQHDHEAVLRRLRTACEHAASVGPTSVIKVHLNEARKIADAYGNAVLDACVQKVRSRIRHSLRDDDALGSVGPGELVVVMPGADAKVAAEAAERIRKRVAESRVSFESVSLEITVSVGIASTQGLVEADSLIAQAEAAAETADNAGGNRVVELPA